MKPLRIFISSPGDVAEEREKAKQVVAALQHQYAEFALVPVLWEDLAIPATASFQEGIDFVLAERHRIDIAVFILWSRLGSPLGHAITKRDGSPYLSGTEREFDLMLAAFEQSGRQKPIILAYTRDDSEGFNDRLDARMRDEDALEEIIRQRRLLKKFIQERFHDEEGRNLRAYHTYREPVGFAQRLHVHLRGALDELLGLDHGGATWAESPYRSLEVFDICHAPIFCGREEETCELLQRLRDQQAAGCAFVCIVGASGSGKSSLARAGVAATLLQRSFDDGVKEWRAAVFVPGTAPGDLFMALARSLAEPLPELREGVGGLERLARCFDEQNHEAAGILIETAFHGVSAALGGALRVLVVCDQMEELWTDRRITPELREKFLQTIEALARGSLSILATLRSDFYPQAQLSEAFLRMKGERGHFDLTPPGPAALRQLIVQPTHRAGLAFERAASGGRSLDERILEDAARDPSALPLLQYALAELYERRDEKQRLLTFAAYDAMGGVEGALGQRAGHTFDQLPADTQAALEEVLPLLISVDIAGEQNAVRRRAPLADLTSTPARRQLTERLTEARFLSTNDQDGTPIAALAHEALLRRWERLSAWINQNRDLLRMRARIEQYHGMWEWSGRDDSRLLPAGLALEEGRKLLEASPRVLDEKGERFVRASSAHHDEQRRRATRRRRVAMAVLCGLTALALIGGGLAVRLGLVANRKRAEVIQERNKLEELLWTASRSDQLAAVRASREGHPGQALAFFDRALRYRAANNSALVSSAVHAYGNNAAPWHTRTVAAFEAPVASLEFSADGRWLAMGSFDKTARVIEAATGREVVALECEAPVEKVAMTADGRWLAAGDSRGVIHVLEISTGRRVPKRELGAGVLALGFTPDGKGLIAVSTDAARLMDVATGQEISLIKKFDKPVRSAGLSMDRRRLWVESDSDTEVIEVATGTVNCTVKIDGEQASASFSHDGNLVVGTEWPGSPSVNFFHATTGEVVRNISIERFRNRGSDLDYETESKCLLSPESQLLAVGLNTGPGVGRRSGANRGEVKSQVWFVEAATGETLKKSHELDGAISEMAFSPDGRWLTVAVSNRTVQVLNAKTGQVVSVIELEGVASGVCFSPDGRWLAIGNADFWRLKQHAKGEVRVMEVSTGQEMVRSDLAGIGTTLSFTPDSRFLSALSSTANIREGTEDYRIQASRWDTATGEEIKRQAFDKEWRAVTASADGAWLALKSPDKQVRIIEAASGKEIRQIAAPDRLVFSPDGRVMLAFEKGNGARITEVATGTEIKSLALDHKESDLAWAGIFSADSRRIAIFTPRPYASPSGPRPPAPSPDSKHSIRIFESPAGRQVQQLESPGELVSISLSPDGQRLAESCAVTTSSEGRMAHAARVWDISTGTKLYTVDLGDTEWNVGFSPDGQWLLARESGQGAAGELRLMEASSGREVRRMLHEDSIKIARLSSDSRLVAMVSSGESKRTELQIAEAATGVELGHVELAEWVADLKFSPDGRWLATATYDDILRLFDTSWFASPDTHVSEVWLKALELQSGHQFQLDDGRLKTIPASESSQLEKFIRTAAAAPPGKGEEWQHAILRWSLLPPDERTTSPWSGEPLRRVIARTLVGTHSGQIISQCADSAPWHPLVPISLARLEPKLDKQTAPSRREGMLVRPKYLARMTLQRLRQADEKVYGAAALENYLGFLWRVLDHDFQYNEIPLILLEERDAKLTSGNNNSPARFSFNYRHPSDPGKRTWLKEGDTWTETQPSGRQNIYKVAARITINGILGTEIQRVAEPGTWAFIPDKGTGSVMRLLMRTKPDGWYSLGSIDEVE